MARPKIAVFSGPTSTIANSPALVTSNKGRLEGEKTLLGHFDHLVAQSLYEPVIVRIKKFSAHPMEEDARDVYFDDGKDYYEVEIRPEDGPLLLPYLARRKDGSGPGTPFEAGDMTNLAIQYGGRQSFYPDASRVFADIDRTIAGTRVDSSYQIDFSRIPWLPRMMPLSLVNITSVFSASPSASSCARTRPTCMSNALISE